MRLVTNTQEIVFQLVLNHVDKWHSQCATKTSADNTVRESVNKTAVSAASPDYVKFQAVIKTGC